MFINCQIMTQVSYALLIHRREILERLNLEAAIQSPRRSYAADREKVAQCPVRQTDKIEVEKRKGNIKALERLSLKTEA